MSADCEKSQTFLKPCEIKAFKLDASQLQQISQTFREKIERSIYQGRLEANNNNNITGNGKMIVAKVLIKPLITGTGISIDNLFNLLKMEITKTISSYQKLGTKTPNFINALKIKEPKNLAEYFVFVCEDAFAYACLERAIKLDFWQPLVKLKPYSNSAEIYYCYLIVTDAIVHDTQVIIEQISCHKPNLNVKRWILLKEASNEEKHSTKLLFLIDENSAWKLNFLYQNNLYVCLNSLRFFNLGQVPFEMQD